MKVLKRLRCGLKPTSATLNSKFNVVEMVMKKANAADCLGFSERTMQTEMSSSLSFQVMTCEDVMSSVSSGSDSSSITRTNSIESCSSTGSTRQEDLCEAGATTPTNNERWDTGNLYEYQRSIPCVATLYGNLDEPDDTPLQPRRKLSTDTWLENDNSVPKRKETRQQQLLLSAEDSLVQSQGHSDDPSRSSFTDEIPKAPRRIPSVDPLATKRRTRPDSDLILSRPENLRSSSHTEENPRLPQRKPSVVSPRQATQQWTFPSVPSALAARQMDGNSVDSMVDDDDADDRPALDRTNHSFRSIGNGLLRPHRFSQRQISDDTIVGSPPQVTYEERRSWMEEKRKSCAASALDTSNYGYGQATPDSESHMDNRQDSEMGDVCQDETPHQSSVGQNRTQGRRSSIFSSGVSPSLLEEEQIQKEHQDHMPDNKLLGRCPLLPVPGRRQSGRRATMSGGQTTSQPVDSGTKDLFKLQRRASLQFGCKGGTIKSNIPRVPNRKKTPEPSFLRRPSNECEHAKGGEKEKPRRSSLKQAGSAKRSSIGYKGEIQVALPGSKGQTVTRRTSISFNEKVETKDVTPVYRLTDQPENLWFQKTEYASIRQKRYRIVEMMENGKLSSSRKLCIRGLECPKSAVRKNKYSRKSVLKEQRFQRTKGYFDDEYVANVYSYTAQQCKMEACERAEQDYEEIEKYLRETRQACRRLSM